MLGRKVRAAQSTVPHESEGVPFEGITESATENKPSCLWCDKGEKVG